MTKIIKNIFITSIALLLLFTNTTLVFAEENAKIIEYTELKDLTFNVEEVLTIDSQILGEGEEKLQNHAYFNDVANPPIISLILSIINFAIKMIGSLAVLIMIIGGFILVVSEGNDTRIEQGKNTIKFAIIGLTLALMSYIIVLFVQAIFST